MIGSDTMLVAPLKIGDKAMTGSGSTITEDIPAGALSFERNAQTIKEKWADNFHALSSAKKAQMK